MRTVLLTGACGGIGRAIASKLLGQGYTVYGLDRKGSQPPEGLRFIACDVTVPAGIDAAFQRVQAEAKQLDAIVHTAGVYDLDSLLEMDEVRFTRMFEVNLFGVYRVNKAFAPLLRKGGRIVITSSELAPLDPLPFTGVYAVTKSALDRYAYSLRMELQLLNISVSVIRAGAVKTDMLGASTDALEKFCNKTRVYNYNAKRFRKIVDGVETKCVPPEKIAAKAMKILNLKKPKFAYSVNCNFLLRILNALPSKLQFYAIRKVLK